MLRGFILRSWSIESKEIQYKENETWMENNWNAIKSDWTMNKNYMPGLL